MCYAALPHALHFPKQKRRSHLHKRQGRQTGLDSKSAAIPIAPPLNSAEESQRLTDDSQKKTHRKTYAAHCRCFQAMSFIHCDHRPTNRIKMGHVHHCKFLSSQQDMELNAGALRFGSSKWIKLGLPNHSSR
jgi:hypothetical protein